MSKNTTVPLGYGDVETTGLDPQAGATVIEFSLQLVTPSLQLVPVGPLFNTGVMRVMEADYQHIQQSALDINKITLEQIQNGRQPDAAMELLDQHLKKWIGDGPFSLMGHNVQFDRKFLDAWFQKWNRPDLAKRMHYRMVDAQSIAWARLVATGKLKSAALGACTGYFGIEHEAHTAWGDVTAGLEVVRRLIGPMGELVADPKFLPETEAFLEAQRGDDKPGDAR